MRLLILLIGLVPAFFCSYLYAVSPTTYYVSIAASNSYVVGNDSNNGTSKSTPWLTVSHAIAAASTGDTIMINDGIFTGTDLGASGYPIIAKGLTIQAENTRMVQFRTSSTTAGTRLQGPAGVTITIQGIIFDGVNSSAVPNYSVFIEDTTDTYTVNLISCTFNQATFYNIETTANEAQVNVTNAQFTNDAMRSFFHAVTLNKGGVSISGATGTITNHNASGHGMVNIKATLAGVTASVTSISASMTLDASLTGAGEHFGIQISNIANAVEADNAVTVTGQFGSRTSVLYRITADSAIAADHGIIRHNTGKNDTTGGYLAHIGSDGTSGGNYQTNLALVTGNVLVGANNSVQHGIMLGWTQGGVVRGNWVSNCGICLLSKDQTVATVPGTFESNVIINPLAQGLRSKGSDKTIFAQNTIYWSGAGPTYGALADDDPTPATPSTNVVFDNNTFSAIGGLTHFAAVSTGSTGSFNNNNYYTDQALPSSAWVYGASNYATLAAWEATSTAANENSVDPLFVNPPTDMRLKSISPLRSAGVTWSASCLDFTGTPCTSPPSIGAYPGSVRAWYVRPAGGSYGTQDGSSYANALNGLTSIVWGKDGLLPGDTAYLCGTHLSTLTVATNGTQALPLILSGACPNDPGIINTAALTSSNDCINITDYEWITVEHVTITGCRRMGILAYALTLNPMHGIVVRHNIVDNRTASHPPGVCHAIYFSGPDNTKSHSNSSVTNNVVMGASASCVNGNNDSVNIELANGPFLVAYNTVSGGHEGLDISSGGSSGMQILGNTAFNNRFAGIKIHGGTVCPVGLQAAGNLVHDNGAWGVIFQDTLNSFFVNNTLIGNGTFGGLEIQLVNSCTQSGNSYLNNIIADDYVNGIARIYTDSRATFEANNTWNGNVLWQRGAQTQLIRFNTDNANSVSMGATFTTWQGSHAKDLNSDPSTQLVNYTSDFRLRGGSTFLRAGAATTNCLDHSGAVCSNPPSLGAYQEHLAAARTPVGGDLLATDSFDGDGATLGANWSNNSTLTVFKRVSGVATSTNTSNDAAARYSAMTWPNDQRSVVIHNTVLPSGLGTGYGPAVRMSTSGTTVSYDRFICNAAGWELGENVNGVFTSLASSATPVCTDGGQSSLEVAGSTLRAWIGTTLVATKKSTLTSGAAGVAFSSSGGNDTRGITNWSGYSAGTARSQRQ